MISEEEIGCAVKTINAELSKRLVRPGQSQAIRQVIEALAPGWDYEEITAIGQRCARIALTTYDPREVWP